MPETLSSNILRRRAERLQKQGNKLLSQPLLKSAAKGNLFLDILCQAIDDFKISCMDPVVLFVNIHTMLIYGVLYLWFELFPFGEPQQLPVISNV